MNILLFVGGLAVLAIPSSEYSKHHPQPYLASKPYYDVVQKPRCRFSYDERLETRALSILQHELSSEFASFYDAARPVVTICRSKATLMFSGTRSHNGHDLLDPSNIYIDVDVCSHRILAVDHDDGTTVSNDSPCE